ncbi:hypothetical protein HpDR46_17980 [Helicobacter pylori]
MISNISTRPKTYPPKLNATFLNPTNFFIKLIIIDELETSLEQNALIRLSNLISLRNTQQLTSIIATHDPVVLDSYKWVGMVTLLNAKILLTLALIASRLIVVIAFIFIVLSSYVL